ncbi:MAG TPA: hypothetical protein VHS96_12525, partial [Bacteroidia bacterium]|nr:hypothetical protein [Bacteroidia bacterium]
MLGLAWAAIWWRVPLVSLAIGAALRNAGASEISFAVTRASLWRVAIEDVGFLIGLQRFAAERVTFDRSYWWSPSLGTMHVDQAHVPVDIGSLSRTPAEATGSSGPPAIPQRLPFEEISFNGQIAIHAGGQAGG